MRRLLLIPAIFTALALPAGAQCVMCYRTAHAQNEARSRVLDKGILILGAPPFLILAGFIAFVFKRDERGLLERVRSDLRRRLGVIEAPVAELHARAQDDARAGVRDPPSVLARVHGFVARWCRVVVRGGRARTCEHRRQERARPSG